MDVIVKYKQFIQDAFSKEIVDYTLQFRLESENSLVLTNKFCSLHFYCDFDKVECDLRLQDFDDAIALIWIPIYGFEKKEFENCDYIGGFNEKNIILYKMIILKYLDSTFRNGEHHWLEKYSRNNELDRNRIMFIYTLPRDHPINLKFRTNDNSWRDDVDELLFGS